MVFLTLREMIGTMATRLTIVMLLASPVTVRADEGDEKDLPSWDRVIRPILRRHCYHCHQDHDAHGDVNLLQDENPRLVLLNRKKWEAVLSVVRSEEMPPEDARELKETDRKILIRYLNAKLNEFTCNAGMNPDVADLGTAPTRRLTRHEYNLAVEDLTGLPVRPANHFPPEPISFGFVGIGGASGMTPVEVNQYYEAADEITQAIGQAAEHSPEIADHFFGSEPDNATGDVPPVRERLQRFADRAFRRPAKSDFVDGLVQIYKLCRQRDGSHANAMMRSMSTVLMSPRFFMRVEEPPVTGPQEEPYPVDAYDLASRLSFFLWASPPDETLRSLAASQQLLAPETLKAQVDRMLADRRAADGLVRGFFAQWLQYPLLIDHSVNADAFPNMDASLNRSMRREVERILIEIVRKDRPITEIIDAPYTFVDARLASHYGLDDAQPAGVFDEPGFHRITLSDRRRGGVVTSAALLTLQADPGRTNVPRRGNYIAGTFLGAPPPPPPSDVPELVADDPSAKSMTSRELLEKHRESPQCASCHAKMDPIGFMLENFDAIGRWRTEDAGQPIDASGELPKSGMFVGPEGLKDLLLSRKADFVETMTQKMLIYALGRGPRPIDRCVIADARERLDAGEDRISAIVHAITQSTAFTHRSDAAF